MTVIPLKGVGVNTFFADLVFCYSCLLSCIGGAKLTLCVRVARSLNSRNTREHSELSCVDAFLSVDKGPSIKVVLILSMRVIVRLKVSVVAKTLLSMGESLKKNFLTHVAVPVLSRNITRFLSSSMTRITGGYFFKSV